MYINEHVTAIGGFNADGALDVSVSGRLKETYYYTKGERPYHLATFTKRGDLFQSAVYEPNPGDPDYAQRKELADRIIRFCDANSVPTIAPSSQRALTPHQKALAWKPE